MARRRTLIIIAALGLASAIFGIAANVATGTLPDLLLPAWKPYLPWVAWPLALISALVLVVLPVRQYLDEHAPGAETTTQEQRNRHRMLEKVRRIWITDFLDRSLYRETLIRLDLLEQPGLVQRPMDLLVQRPDRDSRPLPPGTTIRQVYDELGHELLILGAPGAGKTTLLLDLTRDLLARAAQDATHPIPVVFPLASWAEQHGTLADWLTDELNKRYDVPRTVAAGWIASDAVLPLLDGLDEVAPAQRVACVAAINAFRAAHGLLPIVVCSRVGEYAELRDQLRLAGAIVVQPLTRLQITEYLRQIGKPLAGLRAALREDEALWELLETPLLLSIMTLAYQGQSAAAVRTSGTLKERRTHLFAVYVERMFERRGNETSYTREQTLHWLAWLARRMAQHSQTVFYIEQLLPHWLWSVEVDVGLIGGLIGGLVAGLVAGLVVELVVRQDGALVFGLGGALVSGWRRAGWADRRAGRQAGRQAVHRAGR